MITGRSFSAFARLFTTTASGGRGVVAAGGARQYRLLRDAHGARGLRIEVGGHDEDALGEAAEQRAADADERRPCCCSESSLLVSALQANIVANACEARAKLPRAAAAATREASAEAAAAFRCRLFELGPPPRAPPGF